MVEFPSTYTGELRIDDRGILSAINQVSFEKVKRMYIVENFNTDTIRAFHGHKVEEKQALVVSGSALIVLTELDFKGIGHMLDPGVPIPEDFVPKVLHSKFLRHVASARIPELITIPAGWANGFRALEPNTKILFFSSTTLAEAAIDDYRIPFDELDAEIWQVKNR